MKIKNYFKYKEDDTIKYHLLIIKLKKTTYKIILVNEDSFSSLLKKEEDNITTYFFKNVGDLNAINIFHYEKYFVLDEEKNILSNKKITNKINKFLIKKGDLKNEIYF